MNILKKIILNYLKSRDLEIYKKTLKLKEIETFEKEAEKYFQIVKSNTMLSNARLLSLWEQVLYCEKNNIPGAFVECGTWKGGAMGLMALANIKFSNRKRHLHLFDAFTEICEPDPAVDGERAINEVRPFVKDKELKGELLPVKGVYDWKGGPGTLEENRDLLENKIKYDKNYLHYHKGWFQETLPLVSDKIGDIAILRLDGDFYASTKICLEYLYSSVVHGGLVIIDDYGTYEGCKKAVDDFIEQKKIKALLAHIDSDACFFVKTEK
ncbi:MAG: class I SAM-dependent methyltransferase [Bacteroidetes bacterium]|nr:class I SAM-dependent methyltransferase [Bacteroidota bacterium]